MWKSITRFYHPGTIREACELSKETGAKFIAGGSYLVAEKDPDISALVNINPLISGDLQVKGNEIVMGSGLTLQKLADRLPGSLLSHAVTCSCSSGNIRNQRTIGGEIGQMRRNSELITLLLAINARLEVFDGEDRQVSMREWNGEGIIRRIIIDKDQLDKTRLERFSVLPSAPAFLIVAVHVSPGGKTIVTGGNVKEPSVIFWDDENPDVALDQIRQNLLPDHFGSVEYKITVVRFTLKKFGVLS